MQGHPIRARRKGVGSLASGPPGLLTWVSLTDRLRGEEERGVLLQLGRRVAVRVAVHMVRGLRHLPAFRGRRRRCRRVVS